MGIDIFVVGLGAIVSTVLLLVREVEHEKELKQAFEDGYKKGLYTNVVRVSEEAE
jgi:hypothetical protein